jgi:hypothetical protein
MLDLARRLVWFFVVAAALSYAFFLVAGTTIQKQALSDTRRVVVRDYLKPGEHHLSGMVMVPSSCSQLSVKTVEVSPVLYQLTFTTWQEPYVDCVYEDTPRAFRAIVFAPAVGIELIATLDDTPLELAVILADRNPSP